MQTDSETTNTVNAASIKPLGARVLARRHPSEEVSRGGILIAQNAQERSQRATVVALGTGGRDEDGKPFEFTVKPGDVVIIGKFNGTPVGPEADNTIIVAEREILCIVE